MITLFALTTPINFGQVIQGDMGVQECQIQNVGDEPATITAVTVTSPYTTNAVVPQVVDPGGVYIFDVNFTAGTPGVTPDQYMQIVSDDPASPLGILVQSESVMAGLNLLSVNPSGYFFADTKVGEDSSPLTFDINNIGAGDVEVTVINIPTGWAAHTPTPTLPATIHPGDTLQFGVTFSPVAEGFNVDVITVTSDADNSPYLVQVFGNAFLITPAYIADGELDLLFAFGGGATVTIMDPNDYECETESTCSNTVLLPFQTPEGSAPGFEYEKTVMQVTFHYEDLGEAVVRVQVTSMRNQVEFQDVSIGTVAANGKVRLGIANIVITDEIHTITFIKQDGPLMIVDWVAEYIMKGERKK